MSSLTHIATPDGLAPGNGFSHVVWGEGRFVAISGQVAVDAEGQVVGESDPAAQARQVFANLQRCLEEAGAAFTDVVKFTFFVTDLSVMPALREVRDTYLDPERLPACSAVQVAGLVRPELLIEIEAFAVIPAP
ncbi:RidA family protein [Streptomyces sp. NBC_01795]|uniref:RidA family protein n=1 Tax=unclassified Streptomyces TaxID=2593676 RepID=UPI002DDA1B5B|nr:MULTISPECIES: RidA family protein [unclassified Streptomyces]WSA91492.1 RidA family protein [Streptomyces sp. NBC_01795]WSB75864.1 RidA family protein [Streptomyces sp. NBC_01775]WSS15861.1 RidA family protein [Streptomyces sp. NBC_01186]